MMSPYGGIFRTVRKTEKYSTGNDIYKSKVTHTGLARKTSQIIFFFFQDSPHLQSASLHLVKIQAL